MLVADRNALKANLTVGTLQNQLSMVLLYVNNFQSIAMETILLCGFAFTPIVETPYEHDHLYQRVIAYPFYLFNCTALMCGLFIASQSMIANMYGPAMALRGETPKAVAKAVDIMKHIQNQTMYVGAAGLSCLIISTVLLYFARIKWTFAIVTACIYALLYYMMLITGVKTYYEFHVENVDFGILKAG